MEAAIEDRSLLVIGQDPRNIEPLWQVMYRHPFFQGGIVAMSALSGIDRALHDIKAKHLDIPLWQPLGGNGDPVCCRSDALPLWFIEEPCQPESREGTAQVARSTIIPIAAGERLAHRREFLPLLQADAIAVARPDVCHAGGLTEVRRIAAPCDTFGVSMAPHNPLGPIATMVKIDFGFATPNFLIQEVMKSDVPWRDEIVSGVTPIVEGHVLPGQAPGFGDEIDFAVAARHPYVEVQPSQWYHSDDSVADW